MSTTNRTSSCEYNCSVDRRGLDIPPYPDVSGYGVVIGYTVTAGLVVAIIIVYYFVGYEPELDPFQNEHDDRAEPTGFRPNPIDELLLRYRRNWKAKEKRRMLHPSGLERVLLKCVLNMSDLQIVTGLSILISGFTQLPCGISVYHWQILTYLAWFSNLTHLSCLTFLRKYLHEHNGQRRWRLAAMGLLVILLIVALIPTGNFRITKSFDVGIQRLTGSETESPAPVSSASSGSEVTRELNRNLAEPSDYAICSYTHKLAPKDRNPEYVSMMISVLLVGFGYVSRIVKLHPKTYTRVFAKSRAYVKDRSHQFVRFVSRKFPVGTYWQNVRRRLLYRPILFGYLIIKVSLDVWSSMAFEIWWLLVSYGWGIYNLLAALRPNSRRIDGNKDWTFGQIVPLVLLLIPLVTIFDFVSEENAEKELNLHPNVDGAQPTQPTRPEAPLRIGSSELTLAVNEEEPRLSDKINDTIDSKFYEAMWFRQFVYMFLSIIPFATMMVLFVPPMLWWWHYGAQAPKGIVASFLIPRSDMVNNWIGITFTLGLISSLLLQIVVEGLRVRYNWHIAVIWVIKVLMWFFYTFSFLIKPSFDPWFPEFGRGILLWNVWMYAGSAGVYVVFALVSG